LIFRGSHLETFGFQIKISGNFGKFQKLKIDKQLDVHEINSQMPELQIQLNQQQMITDQFQSILEELQRSFSQLETEKDQL
jgi:hypothetical protein